ncbi:MAG: M48 family metalloprotease [Candidatus Glassbacteria bacterium]|nr:M48 family metalloprotease [Candidatus Glassbacteria bacterium]
MRQSRKLLRRYWKEAFFVLAALCLAHAWPEDLAAASGEEGLEKQVEKLLAGRELYLRERINSSPKVYCTITDSSEAFFIQEEGRLLNLGKKAQVVITGVKHYRAQKRLKVKFRHRTLGEGSINFYWTRAAVPTLESFREMARLAFCETLKDDGLALYVGNRRSRQLHFLGCNHLPEPALQERFSDLDSALEQGYRMCGLCFCQTMVLPGTGVEDYLSSMVASRLLSYYQVNPDDSINGLVRGLGEKVLNNWPTPLRGYHYSFTVLESDKVNACAAPGGKIFVHRGLVDALESENELSGILAHEIAHVERRHGIREYYKRKSREFWLSLAAVGLGWSVEKLTDDTGLGWFSFYNFLDAMVLANEIALAGYSRECETEADYYAVAFLGVMGDSTSYGRALRKLQYNSDVHGNVWRHGGAFAEHPDIDLRVQFADNARVMVWQPGTVFTGCTGGGEPVAEVRFEAQCVSWGDLPIPRDRQVISNFRREDFQRYETVRRLKVFATLSATAELEEVCEVKEVEVRTGGRVRKLDNKEDTRLFPMHEIGCTFECDSDELLGEIDAVELKLRNVEYWRKK